MPDMLLPERTTVTTEGELVVTKIGNLVIKMHYIEAIQYSTWLRFHGKAAKRFAGDRSTHWSVIGNLTAVEAGERPWSNGK